MNRDKPMTEDANKCLVRIPIASESDQEDSNMEGEQANSHRYNTRSQVLKKGALVKIFQKKQGRKNGPQRFRILPNLYNGGYTKVLNGTGDLNRFVTGDSDKSVKPIILSRCYSDKEPNAYQIDPKSTTKGHHESREHHHKHSSTKSESGRKEKYSEEKSLEHDAEQDPPSSKKENMIELTNNDKNENDKLVHYKKRYLKRNEAATSSEGKHIKMAVEREHKSSEHKETEHSDDNNTDRVKSYELGPGSKERAKLITSVRQESNYLYNSNKKNSGSIIVSRRPQIGSNRTFEHYVPCGNCKAMFSTVSYRKHFKKCTGLKCRSKDALLTSRRIDCDIHVKASDVLKNEVFPVMRNDAVVEAIRHDELVIIFANKLLSKYRLKHQHNMIRSKLRAIGRFILEFKKIHSEISNLADVYHPRYFDSVVEVIDIIAGLKRSSGTYRAPGTAFSLGSILKSICDHLISECIKNRDHVKKTLVKDFKKLMGEGFAYGINKSVQEQQVERRFRKQIQLPSLHDLKCLNKYLSSKRREEYLRLKEKFTFDRWKNLLTFLLTSAQIFNRRRSGEIERVQLADFELYQTIDPENEQILQTLGVDIQTHASRFVRFTVRGKLGRPVRVILSHELLIMLQLTVTYRYKAGVHKDNPYLFGLPGRDNKRYNHLSACDLMRKFATECGAKNPTSLRGTELRKHFATQCLKLELDPALVKEVANFMGHEDKIHEQYYRIPILAQDVTVMADLLQKVQGSSDDEDAVHNRGNRESVKWREVNNNSVGDSFTFSSIESESSILTPNVSKSCVEKKAKTKRSCLTEYSEEDSSGESTGPSSPVNLNVEEHSKGSSSSGSRMHYVKKMMSGILGKIDSTYVNPPHNIKNNDDNTQQITMSSYSDMSKEEIGRLQNMPILDLEGNTPETDEKLGSLESPEKVNKRVRFSDDVKDDYVENKLKLVRTNSMNTSTVPRMSILKKRHTIPGSAPNHVKSSNSEHSNQSKIELNEIDDTHSNDHIPITDPIPSTSSTNNPEDEPPTLEISNEKPIGRTERTIEQLQTLLLSCCENPQDALDIVNSDLFKDLIKKIESEHSASVAKSIIGCLSGVKIPEIPQAELNTSAVQANVQIAQSTTTDTNYLNTSFNVIQKPPQGNLFLISPFNPVSSDFRSTQAATISSIVAYPHIPIQELPPGLIPTTTKPPTKPRRRRPRKNPNVAGKTRNEAEINNNNIDKHNSGADVRTEYKRPTTQPQPPEDSHFNCPFAQNIQPTFTFPMISSQPMQGPGVFGFNLPTYVPPPFQHHPPSYPVFTYEPHRFNCIGSEIQVPRYTGPPFMPQNPSTVRPEKQRQVEYLEQDIPQEITKSHNSTYNGCILNSQNPIIADTSHISPMGSQIFFSPMLNTSKLNIVANGSENITEQSRLNQMQIADNDTRQADWNCRTNGSNVLPHKEHKQVVKNDKKKKALKFRDPNRSIKKKIKSCANLGPVVRESLLHKKSTKFQKVPNVYVNENVSSQKIHMLAVEHDTIQKTWTKTREFDNGSVKTNVSRQMVHMQALEEGTIRKDLTNLREQSVTTNVQPFTNRVQFVRENTIQKDCTKLRRQSVNTNEQSFVNWLKVAENDPTEEDWTQLREPSVNTCVPRFTNLVQVVEKNETQKDRTEVRKQSVNANVSPFAKRTQRIAKDTIQKDRTNKRQQFVNTTVTPYASRVQVVGKDTAQKYETELAPFANQLQAVEKDSSREERTKGGEQFVNTNVPPFANQVHLVAKDAMQEDGKKLQEQLTNTNVSLLANQVLVVKEDTKLEDCTEQEQSVNTNVPPSKNPVQLVAENAIHKNSKERREQFTNTNVPLFANSVQVVNEDAIQKNFTEPWGQSIHTNESLCVSRLQAAENDSPQKDLTEVREQSVNTNVTTFANQVQLVVEDAIHKGRIILHEQSANTNVTAFANRVQLIGKDAIQKDWTGVRGQSVNTNVPPFENRVRVVEGETVQKDCTEQQGQSVDTYEPPFISRLQAVEYDSPQKDWTKVREQSVNTKLPHFANRVQLVAEDAIQKDSTKLQEQFDNINVQPFANQLQVVGEDTILKNCTELRRQSVNINARLQTVEENLSQEDRTIGGKQSVDTNLPQFSKWVQFGGEDTIQEDCIKLQGHSDITNEPQFANRLQTAEEDPPQKDGNNLREQTVNINVPPFANRVQFVWDYIIQKDCNEQQEQSFNTNEQPFANRLEAGKEYSSQNYRTNVREQSVNTRVLPFSNRVHVVVEDTTQEDRITMWEPTYTNRMQVIEGDTIQEDRMRVREQSLNTNVPSFSNRVQLVAGDSIQEGKLQGLSNGFVSPPRMQVFNDDSKQKDWRHLEYLSDVSVSSNMTTPANSVQVDKEDSRQQGRAKLQKLTDEFVTPHKIHVFYDHSKQKGWRRSEELPNGTVSINVPTSVNLVQVVREHSGQKGRAKLPELLDGFVSPLKIQVFNDYSKQKDGGNSKKLPYESISNNVPTSANLVQVVEEDLRHGGWAKSQELPDGFVSPPKIQVFNDDSKQKDCRCLSVLPNGSISSNVATSANLAQVVRESSREKVCTDMQELPNGTVYIDKPSYENQMMTMEKPQQREWVKISEHINSSIDNKSSLYETEMQVADEDTRRIDWDWQKLRESQNHRDCVIQGNTRVKTQIKKVKCCYAFETTKPPERTVPTKKVNENFPRNVESSPVLCDAPKRDLEAYVKSENADCPPEKNIENSDHVNFGDDYANLANKIRNSIKLASTSMENTEERSTIVPEILKEALKEDFDAFVDLLATQGVRDKVEKNCAQDTSTVNKTLCDVAGEDKQQQESGTELQAPSANEQMNEENTYNQSETKEKDVAEKIFEEIGGSARVLNVRKSSIKTVVHPPPSQPLSIDDGNTSVPDASNTRVEDAPSTSISGALNSIVQDTQNTSVTATENVCITSIVPDTSNDEKRAASPNKSFINGIVGRMNTNKDRKIMGRPEGYIPFKSKSNVGGIIPALNSNSTIENVHKDVSVDCMDLRVDRKRNDSTAETIEVIRKKPKPLGDCHELLEDEKPVSITDSDSENVTEYIDITQEDVIGYIIRPMSAKKMRTRMWRKSEHCRENNALCRSDCDEENSRFGAERLGCNNMQPVRKLSGSMELESSLSEPSTSSSNTIVTKASPDSPHNDNYALISRYELLDGRSVSRKEEVKAKMSPFANREQAVGEDTVKEDCTEPQGPSVDTNEPPFFDRLHVIEDDSSRKNRTKVCEKSVNTTVTPFANRVQLVAEDTIQGGKMELREKFANINVPPFASRVKFVEEDTIQEDCTEQRGQSININEPLFVSRPQAAEDDSPQNDRSGVVEQSVYTNVPQSANRMQLVVKDPIVADRIELRKQLANTNVPPFANRIQVVGEYTIQKDCTGQWGKSVNTNESPFVRGLQDAENDSKRKYQTDVREQSVNTNVPSFANRVQLVVEDAIQKGRIKLQEKSAKIDIPSYANRVHVVGEDTILKDFTEQREQSVNTNESPFVSLLQATEDDSPQKDRTQILEQTVNINMPQFANLVQLVAEDGIQKDSTKIREHFDNINVPPFANQVQLYAEDATRECNTKLRKQSTNINVSQFANRIQVVGEDGMQKEHWGQYVNTNESPFVNRLQTADDDSPLKDWTREREQYVNTNLPQFSKRLQLVAENAIQEYMIELRKQLARTNVSPFASRVKVVGEDTTQEDSTRPQNQSANINVPLFTNRVQLVAKDAIKMDSTKLQKQHASTYMPPFANLKQVVGEDAIQKDCTKQRKQSVNPIVPPFVNRLQAAEDDSSEKDWTEVHEQSVNSNVQPFPNRVQSVAENAIQKARTKLWEQTSDNNVSPFANQVQVVGKDVTQKNETKLQGPSVRTNETPFVNWLLATVNDPPQRDWTEMREQSFGNREQAAEGDTIQGDCTEQRRQSFNTNEPPFMLRMQAAEDDSPQEDWTELHEQSVITYVPPFANRVQLFAEDAIQKEEWRELPNGFVTPPKIQILDEDSKQKHWRHLEDLSDLSVINNVATSAELMQNDRENSRQTYLEKLQELPDEFVSPTKIHVLDDDSKQKCWRRLEVLPYESNSINLPTSVSLVQAVRVNSVLKGPAKLQELPDGFVSPLRSLVFNGYSKQEDWGHLERLTDGSTSSIVPTSADLMRVVRENSRQKVYTNLRELPNGTAYINQPLYQNQMLTVKEHQQEECIKSSEHTNSFFDNKVPSYKTKMQVAEGNTRRIEWNWQKLRESQKHSECVVQGNTNVKTHIKTVECCTPFEIVEPPERTVPMEEVNENLTRNVKSSPELCDASECDQEAYNESEKADCLPSKNIENFKHVILGDDYVNVTKEIRNSFNLASTSMENTKEHLTILPGILKEALEENFDTLVDSLTEQKEAHDRVERSFVQDTRTVNKTLCVVTGEDEQQQESGTELQTPSASDEMNREDTFNQSDTKGMNVVEKLSEEIGESVAKVMNEHKPSIETVVHPSPSQPPSIDEGNTSFPDAQDTSVTATTNPITTSIVPDTAEEKEKTVLPKKTFINGIVGRINTNKERRIIGSPDKYIPSKSKSTVGGIIPAHNSNDTKKNSHVDLSVDCMDLRVDCKRTCSTTETVEVPRKKPKQLKNCRELLNNEETVSITDSDGENIIEYIDITQDDVIAYTIPPMSAKKMRARMWRKARQRQENNALRRSDCDGNNIRTKANGMGCNNTQPVRELSGDVELKSNVSESSTSPSNSIVEKTSLDSPHDNDPAPMLRYELSDGGSVSRGDLLKEVNAKMPHGKMYYVRGSNVLVRYFNNTQMEMLLASLDGNCGNDPHEEQMRNIENENTNGENPEHCNEIENLSIKSNGENPLTDYNVGVNEKDKNGIIKLDKHVKFSMNESLSANEYVIEMKMVSESVPPDFGDYYQYVTRYQICNSHNPVSLQTFLMLHNTNRLRGLMKNYVSYLEYKARDNSLQNKSS